MIVRKAYKFRLKPTPEIEQKLTLFAGHSRFIWNKCLKHNLERLANRQPIMRYFEMDFWSKLWKTSEEYSFLKECPAQVLQQKLKDLDRAFMDAFDKKQPNKRIPKTRKKNIHDSFRFPEPKHFKIENRHIKLPKIGWVRFYQSQDIKGTPKNATISRSGNNWFVSIQVEQDIVVPVRGTVSSVGIDVGIAKFAATSDGNYIQPLNAYRRTEVKLAIAQRKLSKKKEFSSNWKKQALKVRKIHSTITHARRDFQHKASTDLSKNHAMIAVEALKVKSMSKSAKGDVDTPGKNVAAKSGLNKSILDQGWNAFKRQLQYKLNWSGGILVEVNPKNTSLRCSSCDLVSKENRLSQEKFQCKKCNHTENADTNAARNILAAGHAVLACGASALSAA